MPRQILLSGETTLNLRHGNRKAFLFKLWFSDHEIKPQQISQKNYSKHACTRMRVIIEEAKETARNQPMDNQNKRMDI